MTGSKPGNRTYREIVGINVQRERLGRGMSVEELALRSGVTPEHIEAIENARVTTGLDELDNIARALGLDVLDLGEPPASQ